MKCYLIRLRKFQYKLEEIARKNSFAPIPQFEVTYPG